jgi:hypothetical protein
MNKFLLLTIFIISSCSWEVAEIGAVSISGFSKLEDGIQKKKEITKCQSRVFSNPLFFPGDAQIYSITKKMLMEDVVLLNISSEREYFYIPWIYGSICRKIIANSIDNSGNE